VRPRAARCLCLLALLAGGTRAKECRGGQPATCQCVLACDVFGGQEGRCKDVEAQAKDPDEALKDLIEQVIEDTLRNTLSDQCDAMKCVVECSKRLACLDAAVEERCRNVNRNIDGCEAECEETTTTTTTTVTRTSTTTTTRTSSTTTSTSSRTSTTTTSTFTTTTTLEMPWTMWPWPTGIGIAGCVLVTASMIYGIMRLRRIFGGDEQGRWKLPKTGTDIAAHLPLTAEDPSMVAPEDRLAKFRRAAEAAGASLGVAVEFDPEMVLRGKEGWMGLDLGVRDDAEVGRYEPLVSFERPVGSAEMHQARVVNGALDAQTGLVDAAAHAEEEPEEETEEHPEVRTWALSPHMSHHGATAQTV